MGLALEAHTGGAFSRPGSKRADDRERRVVELEMLEAALDNQSSRVKVSRSNIVLCLDDNYRALASASWLRLQS